MSWKWLKKKNAEKYINDCLAKKEKEIVMEYAQKFFGIYVPGNTVYFYDIEREYTDCPYCNGTGIIEHKCESTGELLQINCSKCDSNHKGKIINKYSYTIYEGKIIESYIKIYSDIDKNALRVFAEGSDSCETPVVTVQYVNKFGATKERNFWHNHNTELFISRDECEKEVIKEVEKLNKKLNK